jgi:hypothetical protein
MIAMLFDAAKPVYLFQRYYTVFNSYSKTHDT